MGIASQPGHVRDGFGHVQLPRCCYLSNKGLSGGHVHRFWSDPRSRLSLQDNLFPMSFSSSRAALGHGPRGFKRSVALLPAYLFLDASRDRKLYR